MAQQRKIVLVAGGTGGHLFPAEALAMELKNRGFDVHLVTDKRAQKFVQCFDDEHIHVIPSATFKGKNPVSLVKTLWQLIKGVRASRQLFAKLKPVLVGGFGGYPTLPPLYAANRLKIATFIHEQNAVMGRANKALALKVNAIAGGFLPPDGRYSTKTLLTGNPVRNGVLEAAKQPYICSQDSDTFHLLVFGGSQGASFFSQIVPEAITLLDEKARKRLSIVQQIRGDDSEALIDLYHKMGVKAEVAPFFNDMAMHIAAAQFIMARSGASTVSEIATIGRPALLIPYPHALDHDQAANAATLAATGGVKVVAQKDLTAKKLAEIFNLALSDSKLLATQAQAAKTAGRPHATIDLADLCEALIAGKTVENFKQGKHL